MQSNAAGREPGAPFDYPEASRFAKLSERTLRNLVRAGKLTVVRVGSRVLIPDDALRALVSGEPQPAAGGAQS